MPRRVNRLFWLVGIMGAALVELYLFRADSGAFLLAASALVMSGCVLQIEVIAKFADIRVEVASAVRRAIVPERSARQPPATSPATAGPVAARAVAAREAGAREAGAREAGAREAGARAVAAREAGARAVAARAAVSPPVAFRPAATAAPAPARQPDSAFPAPPRFGKRTSAAHGLPWLLPRRTAQAAVAGDQANLGDLTVRAASVVGPGHRCEEPATPRQDAYCLGRDPSGRYLLVAVADGISDSSHAELGAAVAARHAVETMRAALARVPLNSIDGSAVFRSAATAILREAEWAGLKSDDVCTALIAAAIDSRTDKAGRREIWVGWVGDVSARVLADGRWRFLAGDRKEATGGIVSNTVTGFLPHHPDRVQHLSHELRGGEALAFVTDGVGDALDGIPEAKRYFADSWQNPPALGAFLNDVSYEARTYQDDRTAVVVWTVVPKTPVGVKR